MPSVAIQTAGSLETQRGSCVTMQIVEPSWCRADLSQEVFMRIFARRHDYRHEASFGSYLRRVAFIGSANRNTVMWRIVGTVAPAYLRTT